MVKFYSKYEQAESFATVTSGTSNIVALSDNSGRSSAVGRALVAANEEVLCWNVKKGELLSRWKDGTNKAPVTALAQSPEDIDVFAVGYEDGTIRLWDFKTETVIISFNGHKSAITTLSFDRTGSRLASGAKDTNIIVWDLIAEVGLFRLIGHKDQVVALHWIYPEEAEEENVTSAASDESGYLLSASKDALVKLWDISTQHCIETHLAQTNGECWAMGVTSDSTGFITAGLDGEMKVWSIDLSGLRSASSLTNGNAEHQYLHDRGILQRTSRDRAVGLHFHPRADYFAVHGADKSVEIWRIRPEDEVQRMMSRKRKRRREKVAANEQADGDAADEQDAPLKPSITDYFVSHLIVRTGGKVRAVDWVKGKSSKMLHLMISQANNQIEVYDIPKQQGKASKSEPPLDYTKTISVDTPGHRTDVRSLALSSDDRMLASASSGGLKIWNVKTGNCLRSLDCGYALCCAFLPGDKIVVVGTKSGELELFDIASSTLIEKIQAHENSVWTLQVHPDGKSLVTGSADKTAKFWNFEIRHEEIPGTKRKTPRLHLANTRVLKVTDDILSLCFSPDARLLAVATLDNTVKVYFTDSLKLFLNLYGHKLPVLNMSISSDSKMIATCSADKNVRLWGLDFGDCHKAFFAHTDSIMQVSFIAQPSSPEETHYFFSASKDRTLRTWDGDKFEQIQRLTGHHGEIWAMIVSRDGGFVVTASHDKSIRVWNKTDEPIFLEEEREREMEELYESTLATQLGEDGTAATGDNDADEATSASKQTTATLTAGEKIIEALDIGLEDLKIVADWKLRKQSNPKIAPPQRDPLFTALNGISAERHVLSTLSKIPAAQLHDALLILPFSVLPALFTFINIWVQRQWEVSLVCRVLFFMLKTHQTQIVASRELKIVLDGMRTELRKCLGEVRGLMGMNLAAVRCVEGAVRERGVKTLEDAQRLEEGVAGLMGSGKKRGFVEVA